MNCENKSKHLHFEDYVEKLYDKTFLWEKRWLVIEKDKLLFYEKRPINEGELNEPCETFKVENNLQVKSYREYKNKFLQNKKNYVCTLTHVNSNSKTVLAISVNNEKKMNKISNIINSKICCNFHPILENKENYSHNTNSYSKSPIKSNQNIIQNLSNQKQNRDSTSMHSTYRQSLKISNNKDKKFKNNSFINHYKNQSCSYEIKNSANVIIEGTESSERKDSINYMQTDYTNKSKKFNNYLIQNKFCEEMRISKSNPVDISMPSSKDINPKEENFLKHCAPIKNSVQIQQNEENSSLSKMINSMLISAKKRSNTAYTYSSTKKQNSKNGESFFNEINDEEIPKLGNTQSTTNIIVNEEQRKKIGKIIKLSFPYTNSKSSLVNQQNNPSNKLNFEQYFIQCDNPSNSLHFNNTSQEISFDEKDKYEKERKQLTNISNMEIGRLTICKEERVKKLVFELENFEDYFFDSSILKRICRSLELKKEDLGLIYNELSHDYLKLQLLTEMIAVLSKKFLKESVIKSMEVVLREKDMNKKFFINSSHQHSIEFCIVDVFNTFLGNNQESEEFYLKILSNEISEYFKIEIILTIKKNISIPNLFVIMQNKNRIFFNDNLDINFEDNSPFVVQDIKYISPYTVNKWYSITINLLQGGLSFTEGNTSGTTNIKRMRYNNFEMKESFDKMLIQLKQSEKDSEELRINLIKNIYFHIFNKRNELALKLCDYYVQKFADTIFLNPIIYLVLAEIYNEIFGLELAKLFFDKARNIINWQFPNNNNPLLIDLNYTFSLVLMKHFVTIGSTGDDNYNSYFDESYKEILDSLEKSKNLCDMFFNNANEKKIKIILQINLLKLTHNEFTLRYNDSFSLKSLTDEILSCLDFLNKKELYKEEAIYLNLFIDIINKISNLGEDIKINFIQRLHSVKKILKQHK